MTMERALDAAIGHLDSISNANLKEVTTHLTSEWIRPDMREKRCILGTIVDRGQERTTDGSRWILAQHAKGTVRKHFIRVSSVGGNCCIIWVIGLAKVMRAKVALT